MYPISYQKLVALELQVLNSWPHKKENDSNTIFKPSLDPFERLEVTYCP